jgi:hypothetical protein
MKKNYIFHKEINRVLEEVYHRPMEEAKHITKRAIVTCEFRYIEYLEFNGLIKRMSNIDGNGKFGIQLTNKGYEVFEVFEGWKNYKKEVVDKDVRIEKWKYFATKYWWLPIVFSFVALIISIITILK